jgi:hypothetical protein
LHYKRHRGAARLPWAQLAVALTIALVEIESKVETEKK